VVHGHPTFEINYLQFLGTKNARAIDVLFSQSVKLGPAE